MTPAVPAFDLPQPPAVPLLVAALLACGLPTLLAYNLPPSATLLNQCLAVALWGLWATLVYPRHLPRQTWPLLAAVLLLGLAAGWSMHRQGLPQSLAWSAQGQLAAAALLVLVGANAAGRRAHRGPVGLAGGEGPGAGPAAEGLTGVAVATAFFAGLLATGLLSALVAGVQVFAPGWTDGHWVATSGLPGRAVGNLRQPNHLCSLLLWALAAAVALHELRWLSRGWLWLMAGLLVFAVELSASRTGAVGLGVLLLWGLLDRRLTRGSRGLLLALPLLYGLAYAAMAGFSAWSHMALGAEARLTSGGLGEAGSPNSRLNIWRNAWALVLAQPLAGVGFGEFNLAWTLTPFAGRPTAYFDHTHNLPLQLAVELGLPLALLVLGLLAWALWRAWRQASAGGADAGLAGRSALVLVLVAALHSLVEYPLWYAYFLLPTALAWGLALGTPGARNQTRNEANTAADSAAGLPADKAGDKSGERAGDQAGDSAARQTAPRAPAPDWRAGLGLLAGLMVAAGGAWAVTDYLRVVVIYAPSGGSGPLSERIVAGQRSLLFAHHADYAAATNDAPPEAKALAFQRAPHSLLDTRLMVAWAQYLAAQGEVDQARWVAARLREFRNPDAAAFFAPCASPAARDVQCQAPRQPHDWRELAHRPRTLAP